MRKILATFCAAVFALAASAQAPQLKPEVFDLLNLDHAGLEKVKALHSEGNDAEAAAELLSYFKGRKGVVTREIRDISKVKITKEHQQWADDALEHVFFVHKGYQPSFSYGEDINWKYWPIKDNELRWQLHRHKWFVPMGRAYRVSGDEKYAIDFSGAVEPPVSGKYEFRPERDNRFAFGLAGGGGIDFLIKQIEFGVRVRYDFGFSDILRNRNKYYDNGYDSQTKPGENPFYLTPLRSPLDNLTISLRVGFRIGKEGFKEWYKKREPRPKNKEVFRFPIA